MRWLFAVVLLIAGCAHDVRTSFPAAPGAPTGTLVLLLSHAASGVTVAVDGTLVCHDQKTDRITVEKLPVGTHEVTIAANGADKQFKVWVDDARTTTVPLGVPHESMGFVKSVMGTLISLVVYSLLN